jgi:ribosomal protein S7
MFQRGEKLFAWAIGQITKRTEVKNKMCAENNVSDTRDCAVSVEAVLQVRLSLRWVAVKLRVAAGSPLHELIKH